MGTIQLYQFTSKSTPVGADEVYIADSANSFVQARTTIAQILANNSSVGNLVCVASNGSDVTGTGSPIAPFASIGHALSTITTSSSTNPYVVSIGPGTYSETGLEIPIWVFLVGSMQQPTKIIDSSGAISVNSSSYSSGSQRLGFQDLNLINSTGLTINFQSIGGSGSNDIYINNCQIVGAVTISGRGSDFLTGNNNQIFGAYTSSGMQEIWFGGYFASTATFNTSGVTSVTAAPELTGVDLFSDVTFTSSGSGNSMQPTLISSQVSGTLTIDQATTNLFADEVSLNAGTLSQTNGGLVTYLSVAKYEGYTPATSGNWSTVPTEVAGALDTVAATGVTGTFTAGSVIFSNGTKLTQDNANLNWNDSNYTLSVTQPSSLASLESVLVVTSDPSGSHGHGNHIQIAGNPNGGGTIFRTGTVANDSWIQMTGGGYNCTGGGTIYVNGNAASESGAEGCVQTTFGLSTSSFQMYDYTQNTLLFQLNNSGVLQLPLLTTYSVLATDGSHNVTPVASSTAGYVLTSNGSGSAPTFQAASSGGGTTWTVETSSTALVKSNGYFANSASQITFTLPSTTSVGDTYIVSNMNTGGFIVAQNSGQSIQFGNEVTTTGTGGSITSTNKGDTLTIVCNVENTGFQVISSQGQLTVN